LIFAFPFSGVAAGVSHLIMEFPGVISRCRVGDHPSSSSVWLCHHHERKSHSLFGARGY